MTVRTRPRVRAALSNLVALEAIRATACGSGRGLPGEVSRQRCAPRWCRRREVSRPPWSRSDAGPSLLQGEVMDVTGAVCATAPPDPEGPGACSVEYGRARHLRDHSRQLVEARSWSPSANRRRRVGVHPPGGEDGLDGQGGSRVQFVKGDGGDHPRGAGHLEAVVAHLGGTCGPAGSPGSGPRRRPGFAPRSSRSWPSATGRRPESPSRTGSPASRSGRTSS